MRHALARILWLVPSLAIASVVAFVLLVAASGGSVALSSDLVAERRLRALPLFVNAAPADVRSLALDAAATVASDGPGSEAAAATLVRLGGAALPHLLPALDTLPPAGRARVAMALLPVARRMNVSGVDEVQTPDDALLFWQRFWEDRALDFRPAVVRRAARRVAHEASAARREEIRELDTYALPELMAALGTVRSPADVARVARVTELLGRHAPACAGITPTTPVERARSAVARCHRWWAATATDYLVLDGPSRIAATLSETQYGKWLGDAAWFGLGTTPSGESVVAELTRRGRWTLALVFSALLGGYGGGALAGLIAATSRGRWLDRLFTALAVVALTLPIAALATWMAGGADTAGRGLAAALAMTVPGLALVSRHQRALTHAALRAEPVRTLIAFGAGPLDLARAHLRSTSTAAAAMLGSDLPILLTAAFVAERAAGLDGLGAATAAALERRDLAWLMALALLSCTAVGLAQILSDALLGALDPRLRAALIPHQEGLE